MDRRDFLQALAAFALWPFSAEADGDLLVEARRLAAEWRAGRLAPVVWQDLMARLFAGADLTALAARVGADRLLANARPVERGARVVRAAGIDGPGFTVKLFAFAPGRANPPHAHDDMVSMHLVLRGRFRVRHFARLADEQDAIVIAPTLDRRLGPGEETTISDARDNVHWHLSEGEALLLDVLQTGARSDTHLLDVAAASRENGRLRARRLGLDEALAKYG